MELDFVTFEQAEALRDVGFPQSYNVFGGTTCHYNDYKVIVYHSAIGVYDHIACAAPSLELAAKWLRDKKNISLEPYRTACGWICMIVDIPSGTDKYQVGYDDDMGDDKASGQFTTFEKALSAGIDKAIKLLKKDYEIH